MENKLREYVESLFPGAAMSPQAAQMKEVTVQNVTAKYQALIAEGKSEEEACQAAIADIRSGIGGMYNNSQPYGASYTGQASYPNASASNTAATNAEAWQKHRQKSAIIVTVSVMLYILSVVPVIMLSIISNRMAEFGVVCMFIMIAVATGLLVFNHMSKPTYFPSSGSYAPNMAPSMGANTERQSGGLTNNQRSVRRAISGAMWCLIVAAYFLISFGTGAWYITWLIFIIGAAIEQVVRAIMDLVSPRL